jgi:hypothetical protein
MTLSKRSSIFYGLSGESNPRSQRSCFSAEDRKYLPGRLEKTDEQCQSDLLRSQEQNHRVTSDFLPWRPTHESPRSEYAKIFLRAQRQRLIREMYLLSDMQVVNPFPSLYLDVLMMDPLRVFPVEDSPFASVSLKPFL